MSIAFDWPGPEPRADRTLAARGTLFALVLLAEGLLLGLRFDTQSIQNLGHQWWAGLVARVSVVVPLLIATATAAVLFAGERLRQEAPCGPNLPPGHEDLPSVAGDRCPGRGDSVIILTVRLDLRHRNIAILLGRPPA